MEALGIIPARGGSQRIPRKNLRGLGGKPLIQWTIEAAQDSSLSRTIVSTEDPEIAALAIRLGAEVVPQPLTSALNGVASAPVVLSALDFEEQAHDYTPEVVCLLHPTSPFRNAADIDAALDLYMDRGRSGSVLTFTDDCENGAIWLASADHMRVYKSFHRGGPIWPMELPAARGLDINTWDDLERARALV